MVRPHHAAMSVCLLTATLIACSDTETPTEGGAPSSATASALPSETSTGVSPFQTATSPSPTIPPPANTINPSPTNTTPSSTVTAPVGDDTTVPTSGSVVPPAPSSPTPTNGETTPAPPKDDHAHCVMGYEVHPTDDTMAQGVAEYSENGQTDAVLQPEVIEWMEENKWQESHFQWHEVRRCGGGGGFGTPPGGADDFEPCDYPELAPDANECENAQDGYEFLVMHRHMLQSLRQLWPSHKDQFEGWDSWPAATDYPELLRPYFRDWADSVLREAAIADNIEENLSMFADEGELGMWLQCGSLRGGVGANSLHGALHFNGYPQNNQSHSVANQRRNLDSYIFWKLHGWIDKIWERYRIAKGLTTTDERLANELVAQCLEMDALAHYIEAGGKPEDETPLPNESGFFHEVVRPGLENFGCATCHGAGEDAGLRLGFQVSSTEIVQRLVNVDSRYAVGYKLVVPGDPDSSWLYLKAAGLSSTAGVRCEGVANCAQNMPPGGGMQLPDTDLANLRKWIEDGAPTPTTNP
jgi:hypothetical protein